MLCALPRAREKCHRLAQKGPAPAEEDKLRKNAMELGKRSVVQYTLEYWLDAWHSTGPAEAKCLHSGMIKLQQHY